MALVRQTHFSGGELAPFLWGRTDLPRFAVGLRRARNFFISRHGMAVSRPGTVYVGTAKYGAAQHASSFIHGGTGMPAGSPAVQHSVVRLVPYVAGDSRSYVLEFGHQYVRFFSGSAQVLDVDEVSPLELATPYTAAEVYGLQWAQVGDILTLTHPAHDPAELSRSASGTWSLQPISFTRPPAFFLDVGTSQLTSPFMVVASSPLVDDAHPKREWQWKVTCTYLDASTGRLLESLPETVAYGFDGTPTGLATPLSNNQVVLYPDRPVTLRRAGGIPSSWVPGAAPAGGLVAYNVYRGRGDLFGFVGTTKERDFVDVGDLPDYTLQPPRGTNPFTTTSGTTEKPAGVAFFQERRVFAGTSGRPGFVFLSATGDYFDFDEHLYPVSGQALTYEVASRRREAIVSILGGKRLLIFTNSSVWSLGGTALEPLDYDTVLCQQEEDVGSLGLPPLIVSGDVLYARTKGTGVRALSFDGQTGFKGTDITAHASHLVVGQDALASTKTHRLVDWTYAEDPWGLVWAVREDGVLLSYTHGAEGGAWTWHDTQGVVVSVCSVPETTEDAVYLAVRRQGGLFIERMASRVVTGSARDGASLDSARVYDGPVTMAIGGLQHLAGQDVWATSVGNPPYGPLTVSQDGIVYLPEAPAANRAASGLPGVLADYLTMSVGLQFTPELELLDVAGGQLRTKMKTVTSVGFEVDASLGVSVGQDLQHLSEWRQRKVSDDYRAPSAGSELVVMPVSGTWDRGGRAALRQTKPLPVTVLGISREMDIGGG